MSWIRRDKSYDFTSDWQMLVDEFFDCDIEFNGERVERVNLYKTSISAIYESNVLLFSSKENSCVANPMFPDNSIFVLLEQAV